jgi:hypothetical protein
VGRVRIEPTTNGLKIRWANFAAFVINHLPGRPLQAVHDDSTTVRKPVPQDSRTPCALIENSSDGRLELLGMNDTDTSQANQVKAKIVGGKPGGRRLAVEPTRRSD